jgi:hypothetical protein
MMTTNNGTGNKKTKKKKDILGDIVITTTIGIGMLGGVVLIMLKEVPPIVVSVFLSMGMSSLVYRFLGGIDPKTSFKGKGFTLTGTFAAFMIATFFFNSLLVEQLKAKSLESEFLVLEVRENGFLSDDVIVMIEKDDEVIEPCKTKKGEVIQGKFRIPLDSIRTKGEIRIIQNRPAEEEGVQESKKQKIKYIYAPEPNLTVYIEDK